MSKATLQERTGQLGWDDLKTVLAVARAGGLSGAARALDMQHSTVFRRIEAIETRLGLKLFERSRSGYRVTAHGEVIVEAAETMEAAALAAERRVIGADARLSGVIRIATSELLAGYLLPVLLSPFLEAHPQIEIELAVSNLNVDLARREADLALRATLNPPEALVGRRLATVQYAVFASPHILGDSRQAPRLDSLPWIGFDDRAGDLRIMQWLKEALPQIRPRIRADSLGAMLRAAAAGGGAVVLPAFAAAQDPRLLRLTPLLDHPTMDLWLLHHPDVRNNARVRALIQHLARAVPAEMERIAREGPACSRLAGCPREPMTAAVPA